MEIKYSQPVAAQSVVVETGTSGLTEEESQQLGVINTVNTKADGLSGDTLDIQSQIDSLSGDVANTVTVGRLIAFG